jgi:hypothetical protein
MYSQCLYVSDLGRHKQLVIILHRVKWASTSKYRAALIIHVPSDYDIHSEEFGTLKE